ncbi:MAG: class I SAM-dependent methyltransferase [Bacteroidales bacterium]|jgi:ubiquinone/menaquinone biosynthesis C-methylase UbiE|nr:class I SAM-dependent methyltransferase [Bacteroidales bacterium]
MKTQNISKLICPKTKSELKLFKSFEYSGENLIIGTLINNSGYKYEIVNGIPDFTTLTDLTGNASFARKYYASIAETYDENVHITFELYNENESNIRNRMIDLLELKPNFKVLEVSAGTGKDSEIIASRLNKNSELWLLDISPEMLAHNMERLKNVEIPTEFVVASACSLPFADNYFDALYCFAGVGHFPDLPKGLKEMARVVRPGGKVVFSEKNVPEWLRDTEYGKICINNNSMFADPVPFKHIPIEARDLCVKWINGNVHYVFDYTVGVGEPNGNFDIELPGERGGTFNTRYYGKIEGITLETKRKAIEAQKLTTKSMHRWLDEIINREAEKILVKAKKNEMD